MTRPTGSPNRRFIPTTSAVAETGKSRSWFIDRIHSGTFKRGVHYRNTSDGLRPTYEFCLAEIEALYG